MKAPVLNILCLSSWYPVERDQFLGNFVRSHVEAIATVHKVYMIVFEKSNRDSVVRINTTINNVEEYRLLIPAAKSKIIRAIIQYRFLKRIKKELPKCLILGLLLK